MAWNGLIFPLLIRFLNLWYILFSNLTFLTSLTILNKSSISPSTNNIMCLSSAWRWSLPFRYLQGFWKSNVGVTWAAFNNFNFNDVSYIHSYVTEDASVTYIFLVAPLGSMNKLFSLQLSNFFIRVFWILFEGTSCYKISVKLFFIFKYIKSIIVITSTIIPVTSIIIATVLVFLPCNLMWTQSWKIP